MNEAVNSTQLREILSWYVEAGVDIALEEAPVDRFAQFEVEKAERAQMRDARAKRHTERQAAPQGSQEVGATLSPAPRQQFATLPDEKTIAAAVELAKSATSIDALRKLVENFDGCNLKMGAKNTVFADGNPEARIMLVGGAPGRDDDKHGQPFVGRSGQLLDRMLGAIGLSRESVYLSNIIPWHPPGERTPTPLELKICKPFIERHIELAAPDILVMLSDPSVKTLMDTNKGVPQLRGSWREYECGGRKIDAMAMLHPSHLLKQPAQKKLAWLDLQMIRQKLSS